MPPRARTAQDPATNGYATWSFRRIPPGVTVTRRVRGNEAHGGRAKGDTAMLTTTATATSDGGEHESRPRQDGGGGIIEARELTRSFDDVTVVKSLDLTIERGSIIGLIGPSGCGKTTTVRLLTGLLRPTPVKPSSAAPRRRAQRRPPPLPRIPAADPGTVP